MMGERGLYADSEGGQVGEYVGYLHVCYGCMEGLIRGVASGVRVNALMDCRGPNNGLASWRKITSSQTKEDIEIIRY